MQNHKGYQQVIEWEYIDSLTSNNVELSTSILLYIIENLTNRSEFKKLYIFSVIPYGWLGYYPAIGVEFISKDSIHLDEKFIKKEFYEIIKYTSIKDFINFTQKNIAQIQSIVKEIEDQNDKDILG